MALITQSDLKTALLITSSSDDAVLTRLQTVAEAFVEQHTGRSFAGGTFTETQPAGKSLIFLRNFPVSSVTDVRVDPTRAFGSDTIRDPTTYVVHADRGVIESVAGPFLNPRPGHRWDDWPEAVRVTYSTPTAQVPAAVTEAVSELVSHWYRQVKAAADQGFRDLTELTDATGTKVWPWGVAYGFKIPAGVLQLLAQFRVPTV
jgi:uncharacterized phiE125 gp8 family phage protein